MRKLTVAVLGVLVSACLTQTGHAQEKRKRASGGSQATTTNTNWNGLQTGANGGGDFYKGLTHTIFENSYNGFGAGDAAYLLDPDGDVRAHTIYPCRVACADPNAGAVAVRANPIRGPMLTQPSDS